MISSADSVYSVCLINRHELTPILKCLAFRLLFLILSGEESISMQWTEEASAALKKAPFFVRKKVRARVEEEARTASRTRVTLADVQAVQKRYLSGGMAREIKGYQLEGCFGPSGCPNRAVVAEDMLDKIEAVLKSAQLLDFLKRSVGDDLKFHHEFRVTLADCPNACSQPQIKDIGIIGAARPSVSENLCNSCQACEDVCKEEAIENASAASPQIHTERCIQCGQCIRVCPTGALTEAFRGFRVQLAGKLGRHPQLARELPGVYSESEVLQIVADCLALYKGKSQKGQRFADIFTDADYQALCRCYPGSCVAE
jgi:ferredoxin